MPGSRYISSLRIVTRANCDFLSVITAPTGWVGMIELWSSIPCKVKLTDWVHLHFNQASQDRTKYSAAMKLPRTSFLMEEWIVLARVVVSPSLNKKKDD